MIQLYETAKHTITLKNTVYKDVAKYCLSKSQLEAFPRPTQPRILYRRFIRIRPFLVDNKPLRDIYTKYVKNKFVGGKDITPRALNTLELLQKIGSDNPKYANRGKHIIDNILRYEESSRAGQGRTRVRLGEPRVVAPGFQALRKVFNDYYNVDF